MLKDHQTVFQNTDVFNLRRDTPGEEEIKN